MEMGGRISAEDAYQMIKTEVKELKKVKKVLGRKRMNDVKLISRVTP